MFSQLVVALFGKPDGTKEVRISLPPGSNYHWLGDNLEREMVRQAAKLLVDEYGAEVVKRTSRPELQKAFTNALTERIIGKDR